MKCYKILNKFKIFTQQINYNMKKYENEIVFIFNTLVLLHLYVTFLELRDRGLYRQSVHPTLYLPISSIS